MVGRLGERPSAWPESRLRPREEKNSECDCQSQLTNTLPYSGCLLHPKYNWNTVDTDSVQTISFLKKSYFEDNLFCISFSYFQFQAK